MKKLFLDDIRIPKDAIGLVALELNQFYLENNWNLVNDYNEFCEYIRNNVMPDFISFDHDLGDEHCDEYSEKTGYDCAKWLIDWCLEKKLKLPDFIVHSANPVGKRNIESYLKNVKKQLL